MVQLIELCNLGVKKLLLGHGQIEVSTSRICVVSGRAFTLSTIGGTVKFFTF